MSASLAVVEARPARAGDPAPADTIVLAHDERHLRRKRLTARRGMAVMVEFGNAVRLADRDRLVLSDGRQVEVLAATEDLLELRGRDAVHLARLAWHLGNRHLPAQVEADRILIVRDPVIADMVRALGAALQAVREPFEPVHGAYHHHHG